MIQDKLQMINEEIVTAEKTLKVNMLGGASSKQKSIALKPVILKHHLHL